MTIQNDPIIEKEEPTLRIQDILFLCIRKKHWFFISLFVAFSIAFLYVKTSSPFYMRVAQILIKDDSNGRGVPDEARAFSDLSVFQSNINANNEMIALRSPALLLEVVKRLKLDVNYSVSGFFRERVVYGSVLPVSVSFVDMDGNQSGSLTLNFLPDNKLSLSDFTVDGETKKAAASSGMLNDTILTPLGRVVVQATAAYSWWDESRPLLVEKWRAQTALRIYASKFSVGLNDKQTSVINLSMSDESTQRAEDFLNMLVAVYNENWIKNKNQIAISTSMFIDERLKVIERELGSVDEDISSYKSKNLLPDVQAASSMYMAQSREANARIMVLNNQLYMARYIKNYLTDGSNVNQLLPSNPGFESSNIEGQIAKYNTAQLERNSLVANSSERNPLVVDLDQTLAAMRKAIVSSIDNLMVTLNTQIKNLEQNEQQATARIAANPSQAKYLLSVERQQKIKESLYLYLLQKREMNELSQAFTAYNTRLITPPFGHNAPIKPQKKMILLIALLAGLGLPVLILFLMETLNSTVRGRKDVEALTMPFIGEIPLAIKKKKGLSLLPKRPERRKLNVVVKEKGRNFINEAFRVSRTNLEFMTTEGLVMVTSVNASSGKTFISLNLGASFAIKGKKVLAIDLDMRRATLSSYIHSPKTGISNYLSGQVDALSDIIVKGEVQAGLDILPVGTIPPNPTELLQEERLQQLLAQLKKEYDYVFIDCPPIEIVADASIINKWVDMTLFVVRTGLLDRSMVPEIEKLYRDQKYQSMTLILNGTPRGSNRYGYYGYSYGYGYGYGNDADNE